MATRAGARAAASKIQALVRGMRGRKKAKNLRMKEVYRKRYSKKNIAKPGNTQKMRFKPNPSVANHTGWNSISQVADAGFTFGNLLDNINIGDEPADIRDDHAKVNAVKLRFKVYNPNAEQNDTIIFHVLVCTEKYANYSAAGITTEAGLKQDFFTGQLDDDNGKNSIDWGSPTTADREMFKVNSNKYNIFFHKSWMIRTTGGGTAYPATRTNSSTVYIQKYIKIGRKFYLNRNGDTINWRKPLYIITWCNPLSAAPTTLSDLTVRFNHSIYHYNH